MPTCAILDCKNKSAIRNLSRGGISYHRFPKNPFIKEKWINATGRVNWFPSKISTICSNHFRNEDFIIKKSGNKYIKAEAEPLNNILCRNYVAESSLCTKNIVTPMSPQKYVLQHIPQEQVLNEITANDLISDSGQGPREIISRKRRKLSNSFENTDLTMADNDISKDLEAIAPQIQTDKLKKMLRLLELKENIIKNQKLQIKRLQVKNRRLGKKNANLHEIFKSIEQKFSMKSEHLKNLENTNLPIQELLARQALNKESGITKQQYSQALRSFALTLHYYSPKAYNYVRNAFDTCLPHPQTLKKWYSKIGGEPGFTREAFEAIKLKVQNTNYPLVGALIIDEMAIRRRIEWDGEKLHGYVNIGTELEGDHLEEAKEALVFLVSAINSHFKVPVGYFLTDGVAGLQRAELVKHCIELLHESGIRIVAFTFDGCAANLAMASKLGCNFEKNDVSFNHPVTHEPVAAVLDPCHMIKLLRNALQTYKIFFDQNSNKIEWQYFKELNNIQEKEKFHLANKLSHHHISYENQRMKVKLATQLFSLSVAKALKFCRDSLNLTQFQGSEATENFIVIINDLFDIYNSKNLHQFGFKKALNECNRDQVFTYLNKACEYISQLKTVTGKLLIKSPRKTAFLGFIACAKSIKSLYNTLILEKKLVCLPLYKISQDHIELFFGNIRAHGGANNNPTARQFAAAYKKLLVHVEIKNTDTGNVVALEQIAILNCSSALQRINRTSGMNLLEDDNEDEDEYPNICNISEFSSQAIAYIAGYIARTLIKKIKCNICVEALTTNESNELHKFIIAKNKGNLLFPSSDLIKICKAAESVARSIKGTIFIKEHVISRILKMFIGTNIFQTINYHQIDGFPTSNHLTDLIKVIAEKYINIRINYFLKSKNKPLTRRQVLTKFILFQGQ